MQTVGWAIAMLLQARGEAARRQFSHAAALASEVLDTVPTQSLRESAPVRLRALNGQFAAAGESGTEALALQKRIAALPALLAISQTNPKPNGTA
ncbi:hypothetical protein [Nonomuraea sp. NPDC050783]|uniref:hypothetical protein n=1 Tax=Nonomuraea sp. NPDC050783 TaxID=3154634 RepID=UPI003466A329